MLGAQERLVHPYYGMALQCFGMYGRGTSYLDEPKGEISIREGLCISKTEWGFITCKSLAVLLCTFFKTPAETPVGRSVLCLLRNERNH